MPGYEIGTIEHINYQSPQIGVKGGPAVTFKSDDEELSDAAKSHELVIDWEPGFKEGEIFLFVRGDVKVAEYAIGQHLNEIINKRGG